MVRAAKWWQSSGCVTVFDVGIKQIDSPVIPCWTCNKLLEGWQCGGEGAVVEITIYNNESIWSVT